MEHFAINAPALQFQQKQVRWMRILPEQRHKQGHVPTSLANNNDKYSVGFYLVVGTKHSYLSRINDNQAGN